jgi:hypothetical protein
MPALKPFRDCLRRHGVQLPARNAQGGFSRPREGQGSPARIRAGIACVPELPPRFRKLAELLKDRYQRGSG